MDAALRRVSMLDGLQGNVLRGYRHPHALYVFARVRDPGSARQWLEDERQHVTSYRGWEHNPTRVTLNVAFTYKGLRRLGVPKARIAHLRAFKEGMPRRSEQLGDVGVSAKARWEPELRRQHHVLLMLTADDNATLDAAVARLSERLSAGPALEIVYRQHAHRLETGGEHFGFADGFSQPAIAGVPGSGPRVGEGTFTRWRYWRRLALGDFVLGYRDEGGLFAPAPHGPLGDDATFMVLRKLHQDVASFRRYIDETARRFGQEPDWLRAKMVGRWPNGSSIARYPDKPGPPASRDPKASRFRYGKDPHGRRCPVGAHVRRANPRESGHWQGRPTQRHRMIRRGMSYGPELPKGRNGDDGEDRGLIFVCYQADIERQFEFVQQRWLADGNSLQLGADRDPVVASAGALNRRAGRRPAASGLARGGAGERVAPGRMVIPGDPPLFLTGIPNFVLTRGGGYYLVPGAAGLRAIAAGSC